LNRPKHVDDAFGKLRRINWQGDESILWTILLLMLLLWAIGSLSGYAGSLVNVFLVGAIAVFVINLCSSGLSRATIK
jgi:hypothetical protein